MPRQTNRWLGDWTLSLHGGQPSALHNPLCPIPVPWNFGGSPNHKGEARSVGLAANPPGTPHHAAALSQSLGWLREQERVGHCFNELLTNSHAPIWMRLMSSKLTTALAYRIPELIRAVTRWWSHEFWLWEELAVPYGPLANRVVGLGGRYREGGYDDTRDVCYRLANGIPTGKSKAYFTRALARQDTFAAVLVRDLSDVWPLIDAVKPPATATPYCVQHFANGHVTRTPTPLNGGDPTCCWVRYSDGVVGTGDDIPNLD